MDSDKEVIAAIHKGDSECYAHLVKRYQRMVYGIAWSRLGDADLCEDATQDTFVKAFRYLSTLRDPAKFPMWLGRIARNVSNSLLRKRNREIDKKRRWRFEQLSAPDTDLAPAEDPTLSDTLTKTLSALSDQHRECLVLFYMEGKNIREAAYRIGISETAMKTRLHRARTALRGRLEKEMDSSLSQLGPHRDLSVVILPLLPTASVKMIGAGGAVKGLFGKSLLSMNFFFWMLLSQILTTTALYTWFGRLEIENLVPSPSRKIRTKIIKGNTVALVLLILCVFIGSYFFVGRFGFLFLFQLGTPFCLWGLYSSSRVLRVNQSPFSIGTVIANATFLLIYVLIGFFDASFFIFIVAMLPLNLLLYHTNKSRPMRHDYNLFLRTAAGLFGTLGAPESKQERISHIQMKSYTQFLGEEYLVRDYRLDNKGVVLYLPPVKVGLSQYFSYRHSTSTVRIHFDGAIDSQLSPKNFRDLSSLMEKSDLQRDTLEEEVSTAISNSLQYFLAGQEKEALTVLQSETDEEIFEKSTADSNEHRYRGRLSIVAALVMLIFFGIFSSGAGFLDYRPRKPVSQEMARDTIARWSQYTVSHRKDITSLLKSQAHPPLGFFGTENQEAYKKAVFQLMTDGERGFLPDRPLNYLSKEKWLYHVIDKRILTMDELAQIGLSRESLMHALEAGDANLRYHFPQSLGDYSGYSQIYSYSKPNIDDGAYRIACLKALGCLDFIDGDTIAREIANAQITPDWELPSGFEPIDVEKAHGLFHFGYCDLRGTRGALWTLQLLGALDLIDQESCIEAILRFHRGKGVFESDHSQDGVRIRRGEEDTYYALESLAILNALDRIPDLHRWRFKPKTSTIRSGDYVEHGVVTPRAFESWAYQLRLEELRAEVNTEKTDRFPWW